MEIGLASYGLSFAAGGLSPLSPKKLLVSRDGRHTGKAFFGKEAEWIWINLLGAVWVFLGFTGIYLWWRTQTKRRDAARKQYEASRA